MNDIAVIGAGPAGSAAAMFLARRGFPVLLIEQHRFPRDKVCGECISALGMDVLARAGLDERVIAAGAVRLTSAVLHPTSSKPVFLPLPRPMWGLSRACLDVLLLCAAKEAGAALRQPARCESLESKNGSSPILRVRDMTGNSVESLVPACVLVADGKAGWCGADRRPPAATGDFGIKAHFENVSGPRDAIELFCTGGTYGGLAAIEAGRWNAAWSVPASMLRQHKGDIPALFERLIESNAALSDRLKRATRLGPWLAAPLPRFSVRRHWPPGVIPIGNAAAALEPIGGEGIGLALRSAELAAEALAGKTGPRRAMIRAYEALWAGRRAGCRTAAKVVGNPFAAELATDVLRHHPRLGRVALLLMGKQ